MFSPECVCAFQAPDLGRPKVTMLTTNGPPCSIGFHWSASRPDAGAPGGVPTAAKPYEHLNHRPTEYETSDLRIMSQEALLGPFVLFRVVLSVPVR